MQYLCTIMTHHQRAIDDERTVIRFTHVPCETARAARDMVDAINRVPGVSAQVSVRVYQRTGSIILELDALLHICHEIEERPALRPFIKQGHHGPDFDVDDDESVA